MNNDLRDYSDHIGYILKSECSDSVKSVLRFTKYNGNEFEPGYVLTLGNGTTHLLSYYDFAYFIEDEDDVILYNFFDSLFGYKEVSANVFK